MNLIDLVPRFITTVYAINFTDNEEEFDIMPYDDLEFDEICDGIIILKEFTWFGYSIGAGRIKDIMDWDDYHHNHSGC